MVNFLSFKGSTEKVNVFFYSQLYGCVFSCGIFLDDPSDAAIILMFSNSFNFSSTKVLSVMFFSRRLQIDVVLVSTMDKPFQHCF